MPHKPPPSHPNRRSPPRHLPTSNPPHPDPGAYTAGIAFLPSNGDERAAVTAHVEALCADEGLTVLDWRELPHDPGFTGPAARRVMPHFAQLFVAPAPGTAEREAPVRARAGPTRRAMLVVRSAGSVTSAARIGALQQGMVLASMVTWTVVAYDARAESLTQSTLPQIASTQELR
ncbi:hypothetical protein [Actinomadura syzygii]|uniref:Glutamine amidotransferase type-2 domain-containing protein n=1 Tax=Actinomadura syzygii TaxID=1427538 RepID=A0A5D0TRF4_9ACTN|nr:hypothetical protein [Actinomadura syzygii]TYC08738.1 hypothetical protein FXF65_37035 [Actinomadura syzygii]